MPAGPVFISYRRDDSAGYARALGEALAREFGAERVFIDVDDIAAGQAFSEVIQQQLGAARLLLVLIGRRWRGEREGAPPRLFDADDFVRREVATALAHGAVVLPVLLDGTTMPDAAQLPPELQPLAGRQALSLDNARYADDLRRLVDAVRAVIGPALAAPPAPPARPRRAVLALAGGALAAGAAAWWGWRQRVPARAAINGRWVAEIDYGWGNARYREIFDLQGEALVVQGSASFLGVPRNIVDGLVTGDSLVFSTRSTEVLGDVERLTVHRYQLRLVGAELQGTLLTDGGNAAVGPLALVARRAPSP